MNGRQPATTDMFPRNVPTSPRRAITAAAAMAFLFLAADRAPCQPAAPPSAAPLFDTLSGDLRDTIANLGRPYLVTADLIVPVGETVIINPGVIFLFTEFTGIQVHGTLLAHGTEEQPIVFTSCNDQRYSADTTLQAAPYDWNGIVVHEEAVGTQFKYCSIEFALFGLRCLTPYLALDSCAIARNAKGNFSIGGIEQVKPSGLYYYSAAPRKSEPVIDTVVVTRPPDLTVFGRTVRRPALGMVSSVATVTGIVVAAWNGFSYLSSVAVFRRLSVASDRDNRLNPSIIDDWEKARKKKNTEYLLTAAGGLLGLLGLGGLTISF